MRSPAIAFACLASASMAGCATTGTTGTTDPVATFAQIVAGAQVAAQGLCAVTPTLESITDILVASDAKASASNTLAQAAATAFCKGVTAKSARLSTRLAAAPNGVVNFGVITVNGIPVAIKGTPVS